MNKNTCPHCGEKISTWKKWQLTDNRYGRKCPECNQIIVLPKGFIRFIQFFNIGMAVVLVLLVNGSSINRVLFLLAGAAVLILLNILILQIVSIKKPDNP